MDENPREPWRWWAYCLLMLLFPVIFHPWWMAIISLSVFIMLISLILRIKPDKN